MRKMSHLFWFLFNCQEKSTPCRPQPFQCYIQPPKLFNKQQYSKPKSNPATYPNPHNRKISTFRQKNNTPSPGCPSISGNLEFPRKQTSFSVNPEDWQRIFRLRGNWITGLWDPLGKSPASSSLSFMPWELPSISATATTPVLCREGVPCWYGKFLNDFVQ